MPEQVENGPGAEFHDPERRALIGELEELFANPDVVPELWALFWLSDIDVLKEIVREARQDAQSRHPHRLLHSLILRVQNGSVVKKWCEPYRPALPEISTATGRKRRRESDLESNSRHSTGSRSKAASGLCRERDNGMCIITHADEPVEVAHIFPYSLRSTLTPGSIQHECSIWSVLRLFWPEERIQSWLKELTTPKGTERLENLLTLEPSSRNYHEYAFFALKPGNISEDGKVLTATFYWMPRIVHSSRTVRLSTLPSIPHDLTMRGDARRSVRLYDVTTDAKICSGDKIRIQTDDPEALPLPSKELLDLQWVLHRVPALTGGMEEEVQSDDDSDYFAAYDVYGQELQSDNMFNEWIQTVSSQDPVAEGS